MQHIVPRRSSGFNGRPKGIIVTLRQQLSSSIRQELQRNNRPLISSSWLGRLELNCLFEGMAMQKQMANLWFRLMALEYRVKSTSVSPLRTLEDAGIQPGMSVLDFGCGPGRYALPTARIVGSEGVVYAVDVHPLAIKMVEKTAKRARLSNLYTIRSDCDTGLSSSSIDIVLLYDALHDVEDKDTVLQELHRVLNPHGTLSYKDHTLKGEPLFSLLLSNGFSLLNETSTKLTFRKC